MEYVQNKGISNDALKRTYNKGDNGDECGWCGEGCFKSDKLDTLGWGVLFVWAAMVLLAESTGYVQNFPWWWDSWGVFFTGAGIIVLSEAVVRMLVPAYHHAMVWNLICGAVLTSIGLGDKVSWMWPIVLVIIGFYIFKGVLSPRN